MKLTKKTIIEALNMFCNADHPGIHCQKPYKEGNYIFSTDGFSMVWFDKSLTSIEFKSLKTKKFNKVIPDYSKHISIKLDVKKMKNSIINNTPKVDEMVNIDNKCPTCNGKGSIGKMENTEVCCECYGNKTIQIQHPTGNIIPNNSAHIYDGEAMFTYWQIMRILELAELLKIDEISLKHGFAHDPYYYEIGDFKAIMMPVKYEQLLMRKCIQIRY